MAIASFRGEKSVADLADKLYTKLTPRQRELAVDAILKANPQLAEIDKVPQGTLLNLPVLPELRAKATRKLESPDDQIVSQLRDALNAHGKRLAERNRQALTALEETRRHLEDKALAEAIHKNPALPEVVQGIVKVGEVRSKELADRQKRFELAVAQILKDLDGL